MPLFTGTQRQYYAHEQSFTGNGSATGSSGEFDLTFSPLPASASEFQIFIDGTEQAINTYTYTSGNGRIVFTSAPANGAVVLIRQTVFDEELGNYQYIGIDDLVNNFQINYVGGDKIITKCKLPDIAFHTQRAIAELTYDTLRSEKSQEIEVPPSLNMKLPHDYVNYVKVYWVDNGGVERIIYPARKTSNPKALLQDANYNYQFNSDDTLLESSDSEQWTKFKAAATTENTVENVSGPDTDATLAEGRRYGLTPEHAQFNGLFFIDQHRGYIYFSSDMNKRIVVLKYISDSLGSEGEIRVHKFAEEAVYKWVAHAILASKANTPEYLVARFKKERFATTRQAKLRLSNLKVEELSLIMKNKSKTIKH